ncbi:hypothetical protein [Acidiplasma cupricumulans]|uniref:DUF4145 domain-containing protein n=1 Tax=Acidiplasma cupricumulans TaxID=312540 RepID=A0A0Q0WJX8_9ARCH|nr:hypothetical protein [Acidiplasma cupricumulans]KQB35979.1 hypothetical protein AOG55_05295 [Acidiplasma cupricumulans]
MDVSVSEYADVCDILEEKLKSKLKECYPELEFEEDDRNGETVSLRFSMPAIPNPPEKIGLNHKYKNYMLEGWELEPEKFIYPDKLQEIINAYFVKLEKLHVPFDAVSIGLIEEAMKSIENEIYNGTVVLCRSIIDSSLYLACSYKIEIDQNKEIKLILDPPESFLGKNKKLKTVNWHILEEEAKKKFPNLSNKIEDINTKVRTLGNFAAHLGESQIRAYMEWFKKNKYTIRKIMEDEMKGKKVNAPNIYGYKLWTSKYEAESALEETIRFLIDLVDRY